MLNLNAFKSSSSHVPLSCKSGSDFCNFGCWFLKSESGCKNGSQCHHCHAESCCYFAEIRRREIRKEHSRTRPSKKKRDRDAMYRISPFGSYSIPSSTDQCSLLPLSTLEELLNYILSQTEE